MISTYQFTPACASNHAIVTIRLKVYRSPEGVAERVYLVESVDTARKQAEADGFRVLSVQSGQAFAARNHRRFPLSLFATELLSLLTAGLNVIEAVDALSKRERGTGARTVLTELRKRLAEGLSFSRALEHFPQHFPELFIAAMRASERTGNLADALERYLNYRTQLDSLRKKFTGAAIYPALIICVGFLVILFLLGYVVPRFSQVYADMGNKLPASTRWLISWGSLVSEHGVAMLVGAIAILALLIFWFMQPTTRSQMVQALWRVPALGERLRLYQLARFYRTLGMLQRGGIPLVQALGMTARLLPQAALASGLKIATQQIGEGLSISISMTSNGLTDDVADRLLQAGERNGNLGEMMERVANFYDDEMGKWLDWASRLFEPLLMAIVGAVIGAVVLMMYLPIFELASGFQ